MKRLLALAVIGILSIGTSQANPMHHESHYHRSGSVIVPLVIAGAVGYALAQPRTVVVNTPPPVYYPNTYPPVPYGYHYEQVLDGYCNCYRWVLVPN